MPTSTRSVASAFAAFTAIIYLSQTVQALSLDIKSSFQYGEETVRGVNLGGWLVLEVSSLAIYLTLRLISYSSTVQPWITPRSVLRLLSCHKAASIKPFYTAYSKRSMTLEFWTSGLSVRN